jgi:hypothetical protein
MKQYQFEMINKGAGRRVEHARATAATPEIARAQIVLMYGSQFTVAGLFSDINPPHRVIGEIDCSDFPQSDFVWLEREANKIEGVTA